MKDSAPIRLVMYPWERTGNDPRACLPSVRKPRQAVAMPAPVEDMPTLFTFVLVDEIAEAGKLSKGKARKAIRKGKVTVNDVVVYDPDMRVDKMSRIVFRP